MVVVFIMIQKVTYSKSISHVEIYHDLYLHSHRKNRLVLPYPYPYRAVPGGSCQNQVTVYLHFVSLN